MAGIAISYKVGSDRSPCQYIECELKVVQAICVSEEVCVTGWGKALQKPRDNVP